MAFSPKCSGTLGVAESTCPHCGDDFPAATSTNPQVTQTFPYFPLADLALVVPTTAVSGFITIFGGVASLLPREWFGALVFSPIVFLVHLGLLVVFLRIQQMDR